MTFKLPARLSDSKKPNSKLSAPLDINEVLADKDYSHREIMVVIFALMGAMLLAALDQTIVATALPQIAADLDGLEKLSWVATAYLLTSAVVTPLYGKISDMYGRKKIFVVAISIFLLGSVLCGISQTMNQLIFFRAVQGLGGGGIFALVFSIIGDIVAPRQRGRYQGYFGAVFGLSSVIGPIVGGLFTDFLSWRWIFYINLPVGAIALAAIWYKLHIPVKRNPHKIDFAGAGLLAIASSSLLLSLVWGGSVYGWLSAQILSLASLFIGATGLFIFRESKAAEPIIPLRLFKNEIFRISAVLSLLSGLIMFGAIIFLPEYQQIVRRDSATESGLLLIPLVFGLLVGTIVSGRLISRYGHYRPFPIIGTLLVAFGLLLFSNISATTSQFVLTSWMLILGLGIGLFMQVMTVAVQNAVDRKDLGTATSVIIYFRTIGSALGAAIFGAILTSRLAFHLQAENVELASQKFTSGNLNSAAEAISTASPAVQQSITQAFAFSFQDIFLYAVPFAVVAFLVALMLREIPLRQTNSSTDQSE